MVRRHERGGAHPETDIVISLASWLRRFREHHNLTRPQAADITGVSWQYLKDIENNGLIPSPEYLENIIAGYRMNAAQTRLTWDLWRAGEDLPPVEELRDWISTPDRLEYLARLDRSGVAIAYLDPLWNILRANETFAQALPDAGASTEGNFALWALPPAPAPSPAEALLVHPVREARWLVGMLRTGFGRYRSSPQLPGLYQQLTRNNAFNHHWRDIQAAYGRCLHQPLLLRDPTTRQPYTLDLQITEITDAPVIRSFVAWPPPPS